MRVLICGNREWTHAAPIVNVLEGLLAFVEDQPLVVIEGCATGADSIAHHWRRAHVDVTHEHYPADWARYRKAAGVIRNQQMLDEGRPDVVWAFHEDLTASKGTADMVRRARKAGVPTYVVSGP